MKQETVKLATLFTSIISSSSNVYTCATVAFSDAFEFNSRLRPSYWCLRSAWSAWSGDNLRKLAEALSRTSCTSVFSDVVVFLQLIRSLGSTKHIYLFRAPSSLPDALEFACPGRRITLFVFLLAISGRIPRSERKTTITNTNRDCKAGKAVPLYYHQIVYMLRPKYPDTGWTSSVRGDNIIIIIIIIIII